MNLRTLNDVFFIAVERNSDRVMMQREATGWIPISSQEVYRWTAGVARTLAEWGIRKGDRVAILSENRPEWTIADFACLLQGIVVVPIYSTLTSEQTAYLLRDAGARAIFVSDEPQLQKILSIRDQTAIGRVIVMDAVETAHALHMHRVMREGPEARDTGLDQRARSVQPDDLATIIYTSGTTGRPKGAMLTHENMASNLMEAGRGLEFHPGEVSISFLPLSHVTARHVDMGMLYHGTTLAYVPAVDQLPRALQEVHPDIFIGVPRVYEKIHTQVDLKAKSFLRKAIYQWAVATGGKHKEDIFAGRTPNSFRWKVAKRLVYSKIRDGMGGKARVFLSGGAPLGRELAEWYATVGISIYQGYGLTETSPVIAVNTPAAHKLGTVGRPLRNLEVRIAEDGEVLVRGPSVFHGYWGQPEETEKAFVDGWFKTGDIGNIDGDGFLSITDRKKDLIKTSGGKFIAPQPIENSLVHNPLIAEAVIVGDKYKFPAVILLPYFPLLEDWARSNQITFSSRQELVKHSKVQTMYEGIVADLNQGLARFEKLKKVLLVAQEFSTEDGTLTASMKVRRHKITERYREEIEQLYAEAEAMVGQAE